MKILIIFNVITLLLNVYYLIQIWFALRVIIESYNGHRLDLELLKFNDYLKKFNKNYSRHEYHNRFQFFKDSLVEIARLNALEETAVFGLTKFSDMSPREYSNIMLKGRDTCIMRNATCDNLNTPSILSINANNSITPNKFDWREHGCLSPVLDQKLCAGCWAFSIIGVMECMASRQKNKTHERLSIQEFIDCANDSYGCHGGFVSKALDEFCDRKIPVTTEEKYPLTLKEKHNNSCALPTSGIRIKEFGYQCLVNEREIPQQIANYGPLVTIINGAPLQNYLGGIIRRACVRNELSAYHAVQIIGYDTTGVIPFYILKNSYGENFGENGYFRLAMYENVCGVREEVSYIDVE